MHVDKLEAGFTETTINDREVGKRGQRKQKLLPIRCIKDQLNEKQLNKDITEEHRDELEALLYRYIVGFKGE